MIEIVEELKKLGLKEILGYAIESEKAANAYYMELARNAPGLAATRLENLAREEEMHRKTVQAIYEKNFGDESYRVPENLPPLESSVTVDTVTSLIHALETAMQNEYTAYRVYRYLATQEKEHKDLFKYLASMEKGHYEIVRDEKDTYEGHIIENPKIRDMTPHDAWLETFGFAP
jgi:rubrerythrin